ncbi:hypothetical protein ES708_26209 [subsurface metagenome]
MNLEQKLEEAKTKRGEIIDKVNKIAEEIENLKGQRQILLQEGLRYDGEVRTLAALVKEAKDGASKTV